MLAALKSEPLTFWRLDDLGPSLSEARSGGALSTDAVRIFSDYSWLVGLAWLVAGRFLLLSFNDLSLPLGGFSTVFATKIKLIVLTLGRRPIFASAGAHFLLQKGVFGIQIFSRQLAGAELAV